MVRPGGSLIISDMHPVLKALGGAAFFQAADGANAVIRGHAHSHADYLDAFAATDLRLRHCIETGFGEREVQMQQPHARRFGGSADGAKRGSAAG